MPDLSLLHLKVKEQSHEARNVRIFQKLGIALNGQLARKWKPQSYNHKEQNSADNLNEQGNRNTLKASRNEYNFLVALFSPVRFMSDI